MEQKLSLPSPKGSLTWKIDFSAGRLGEIIGGREAAMQSAAVALTVPRYEFLIYSDDYGSELSSLLGKDEEYIATAAPSLIWEALAYDDRLIGVKDVTFFADKEGGSLSFTLLTIDGTGTVQL